MAPSAGRKVLSGPSAGEQRVCENPDKLLLVPRLVGVPAANAVSPSSGPVSFEK